MTSHIIENITHPMSQSCYIVAVWHRLKTQLLHKIKQNTIAKKYRYIGIFFPVSVFVFSQIPQQPTSYYNRVVKIWNTVCQEVSPDIFHNPNSFKHYLKRRYHTSISNVYDVDMACTWSLTRDCPCHRT
jgi:hypothetical protein